MRALHRFLGYLTLGLVAVYALSGIALIHRTSDFLKKSAPDEQTLAAAAATDETRGNAAGNGRHGNRFGAPNGPKKEFVFPLDKLTKLHKVPAAKNACAGWFSTVFGVILFFLALSSLFMYKTSTKQFKTNMILTAAGIVLAVVLICIAG